jgi:hypothetical protein
MPAARSRGGEFKPLTGNREAVVLSGGNPERLCAELDVSERASPQRLAHQLLDRSSQRYPRGA